MNDVPVNDEIEPEPQAGTRPGHRQIMQASLVGTVVFTLVAVASAVFLEELKVVIVVVSAALFAVGCVAFLWAFALAVERSRTDAIGMGGLFFLQGTAPRAVQVRLFAAFGVQVVVAVATASARPFTNQAFAVLAPMFGLGIMGLWGARFGRFAARPSD